MKNLQAITNRSQITVFSATLLLLLTSPAWAIYDSGSDGSLGDLNLDGTEAEVEIDLPPSGILHYANITIAAGVKVTFKGNALNTPVYMLATGDVVIEGEVNLNGHFGVNCPDIYNKYSLGNHCSAPLAPGGFSKGLYKMRGSPAGGLWGPTSTLAKGDHQFGSPAQINLVGGPGGSGNTATTTSNGGGAITIASSGTILFNGSITASGVASYSAGGLIRLIADEIAGGGVARAQNKDNNTPGIIKFEAFMYSGAFTNIANPSPHLGTPQVAVPYPADQRPSVTITKVDAQLPTGTPGFLPVNMVLARGKTVQVEITTKFVPVGTVLKLSLNQQYEGIVIVESDPTTGSFEEATVTVELTLTTDMDVDFGALYAWAQKIPIP
jgi:hypothetical protein